MRRAWGPQRRRGTEIRLKKVDLNRSAGGQEKLRIGVGPRGFFNGNSQFPTPNSQFLRLQI